MDSGVRSSSSHTSRPTFAGDEPQRGLARLHGVNHVFGLEHEVGRSGTQQRRNTKKGQPMQRVWTAGK